MKLGSIALLISGTMVCAHLAQAQSGGSTVGSSGGSYEGTRTSGSTASGSTTTTTTDGAAQASQEGVETAPSGTRAAPTREFSGAVSSTELKPQAPNNNTQVPRNEGQAQQEPGTLTGSGAVSSTALGPGAGTGGTATGAGNVSGGVGIGAGTSTGLGIGAGTTTGLGIGPGSSSGVRSSQQRLPNGAWIPHATRDGTTAGNVGGGTMGGGVIGGGFLPAQPSRRVLAPGTTVAGGSTTNAVAGQNGTAVGGSAEGFGGTNFGRVVSTNSAVAWTNMTSKPLYVPPTAGSQGVQGIPQKTPDTSVATDAANIQTQTNTPVNRQRGFGVSPGVRPVQGTTNINQNTTQ